MRVDVVKYLIVGPWSRREVFFKRVQELGIVEFISTQPSPLENPPEIQVFVEALHVLRAMVPVKQVPPEEASATVLAHRVVDRNSEIERLREEERILEKEIARIEPFGHFSLTEVRALENEIHRTIQFFYAKSGRNLDPEVLQEVIFITSEYGLNYYIAINREPKSYPGLIEMHFDHSLDDLNQRIAEVQKNIDIYEMELRTLAHHKKMIHAGLIDSLNRYNLENSTKRVQALLEGELFAVEGWIPKDKIPLLLKLSEELDIHAEPIKIEGKDRIPTQLENEGLARIGEDLINIYDTPSHADRDPSLWVFFSFALFFSMIVADVGYGLVLLAISLFLYFKFGKKGGGKRRVILLSMYLSVGCILWGLVMPSFFGIALSPENPWRRYALIDWMAEKKAEYVVEHKGKNYEELVKQYPALSSAKTAREFLLGAPKKEDKRVIYPVLEEFSDHIAMEMVLFIGTIHIMISLLRYLDRNWSAIGWVIFMVGSYLYFPSVIKAVSLIHFVFGVPEVIGAQVGFYLVFIGLGLACLLAVIQKRVGGLGEIMHVIGVFADVMSYLRIYALSLAGMMMATTFNKIGSSAPIFVGIFIILVGHLINFFLALMGGTIHGLRLNFIEWYHYSFEGGGKRFRPLELYKIEK